MGGDKIPLKIVKVYKMDLRFVEKRMTDFIAWIKNPANKKYVSDCEEIRELSDWVQSLDDKEAKIWAIFLYTCTDDLDSAKELYRIYPDWKSLDENWKTKIRGAFGEKRVKCKDHRKYRGDSATIDAIESYVSLVRKYGSQLRFFESTRKEADPFDYLFRKTKVKVRDFGRLASWDFLERIDRCGALDFKIVPKRLYLEDATGPKKGFKLMVIRKLSKKEWPEAEKRFCKELKKKLGDDIDIRDIETSLCNFQKRRKAPC